MSDETLTRVLAGLQGRRFRGRSDLYRWLRANYKRLGPRLEQDQISWVVLAREIAAAGLKNKQGAPPGGFGSPHLEDGLSGPGSGGRRQGPASHTKISVPHFAELAAGGRRAAPARSLGWRPAVLTVSQRIIARPGQ